MHLKALESEMKDKNVFGVDISTYLGIDQKLMWIRAWSYFSVKLLNEEDIPFLCVQLMLYAAFAHQVYGSIQRKASSCLDENH
jgi:hypothetical protein